MKKKIGGGGYICLVAEDQDNGRGRQVRIQ